MNIQSFQLGTLQTNCYFIIENKNCIVIDPADSADFILEKIQRENLQLTSLIATHGHFDHILAVGEIQLSIDVPFFINTEDMFLIKRMNETAEYFLGFNPGSITPKSIKHLSEFKHPHFKLIHTPGHTPGSSCLYVSTEHSIFTGDTLFKQAVGRYDFSYSDKKKLFASIDKLFKLPEDTIIYSGHGEMTTIGEEKTVDKSFESF